MDHDRLGVPPELQHLLEKREQERRQSNSTEPTDPSNQLNSELQQSLDVTGEDSEAAVPDPKDAVDDADRRIALRRSGPPSPSTNTPPTN